MKKIKVTSQGAETLPLDQLRDFQGDLKTLSDKNRAMLEGRIIKYGINAPVFVWKRKGKAYLLDGSQRVKVLVGLRDQGYEIPEVPVAIIQAKDIAEAKDKLLGITSQYGEFTDNGVITFLDTMQIPDDIRLVDEQIRILENRPDTNGDDTVMESAPHITETGDIWFLGKHRLLCGDATDMSSGKRLMDGKLADMAFTDPPYGVNVTSAGGKSLQGDLTFTLIPFSFDSMAAALSPGGAIYMCGGNSNLPLYFKLFEKHCRMMPNVIVWVKDTFVMRHNHYHARHELIFFGWKPGAKSRWYGDRKQDDVWHIPRERNMKGHPTVKPVEMVVRALENSCGADEICIDPFSGSGSTLIACEKTGRKCYAIEIDPYYCDVTVYRYVRWCVLNDRPWSVERNGKPFKPDLEGI